MPEEIVMVSTCPLCGGPEEVPSMVTVEIDRIIPKGRAAIMLCRNCCGAVIRACRTIEPPLLTTRFWLDEVKRDLAGTGMPANYPCARCGNARTETPAPGCSEPEYHEEPDDGPSTD